jgi:hypothetical protein
MHIRCHWLTIQSPNCSSFVPLVCLPVYRIVSRQNSSSNNHSGLIDEFSCSPKELQPYAENGNPFGSRLKLLNVELLRWIIRFAVADNRKQVERRTLEYMMLMINVNG